MVYDGPSDKSMLIGELSGSSGGYKAVKSISSSGKPIYLYLYLPEVETFQVNVNFVASIKYKKIHSDCQSWLDLDHDVLMSPNKPNINCSWIITRKFGTYISVEFSYIEVKYINLLVINIFLKCKKLAQLFINCLFLEIA